MRARSSESLVSEMWKYSRRPLEHKHITCRAANPLIFRTHERQAMQARLVPTAKCLMLDATLRARADDGYSSSRCLLIPRVRPRNATMMLIAHEAVDSLASGLITIRSFHNFRWATAQFYLELGVLYRTVSFYLSLTRIHSNVQPVGRRELRSIVCKWCKIEEMVKEYYRNITIVTTFVRVCI